MGIVGSVGRNGNNSSKDATVIQVALNYGRPVPLRAVDIDGVCGNGTKEAIDEFQGRVVRIMPTGLIKPDDATLAALRRCLPAFSLALPVDILKGIMPSATWTRLERYAPYLRSGMAEKSISTPLRAAHFIAQLAHESGSFRYTEEIASGAAYEGRKSLGNTEKGDGVRFKGRGLIQLTGRSNYAAFGLDQGMDLTTEPNNKLVATDPELAVAAATWFWSANGLNELADKDDVNAVTKKINGGYNGLDDRKSYLRRAKWLLQV